MKQTLVVTCLLSLAACAGAPPRDRYVEAVKARAAGDNKAYYDTMVELAHDAPDTRVGRKARANLNSGMFGSLYWFAILAAGLAGYMDHEVGSAVETLTDGDEPASMGMEPALPLSSLSPPTVVTPAQ